MQIQACRVGRVMQMLFHLLNKMCPQVLKPMGTLFFVEVC